ncbi:MAG TPA: dethiobiotin synthase [Acidimicrobiales bacterium]|nr:dethiobiotin synthase [Acidimicrobiales bacterium]
MSGGARPDTVVLVAGTGTEVGKTWVSARLLERWRAAGLTVAARKPAQSGTPGSGPADAEVLGAASGEDPDVVCPPHRSYPVALAPPMAAEALGRPVPTVADLVGELAWPPGPARVGLVETAGGVRSPQAGDGDVTDLLDALLPEAVVVVADAGLGAINAVRLSLEALGRAAHVPALGPMVVLNRFDGTDDLHRRNADWLARRHGVTLFGSDLAGLDALGTALVAGGPPAAGT